jgi:hypothetical protein
VLLTLVAALRALPQEARRVALRGPSRRQLVASTQGSGHSLLSPALQALHRELSAATE